MYASSDMCDLQNHGAALPQDTLHILSMCQSAQLRIMIWGASPRYILKPKDSKKTMMRGVRIKSYDI